MFLLVSCVVVCVLGVLIWGLEQGVCYPADAGLYDKLVTLSVPSQTPRNSRHSFLQRGTQRPEVSPEPPRYSF